MESFDNKTYIKATLAGALVSSILALNLFGYINSIEIYDSFNAMIILLFVVLFVLTGIVFSLFVQKKKMDRKKAILLVIISNFPYLLLLTYFSNFISLIPMMIFCPVIGLWFGRRMTE